MPDAGVTKMVEKHGSVPRYLNCDKISDKHQSNIPYDEIRNKHQSNIPYDEIRDKHQTNIPISEM